MAFEIQSGLVELKARAHQTWTGALQKLEGKKWCQHCKGDGNLVWAESGSPLCRNCEYDPQLFGYFGLHRNPTAVDRIVSPIIKENLDSKLYETGWEELTRLSQTAKIISFELQAKKATRVAGRVLDKAVRALGVRRI